MISRLTGKIIHIDSKYIVLDVHDVGYKISTTTDIMIKIAKKETGMENITIWTYLSVRENALDLYGFISLSEINFFELLINISGIGPKTALSILNLTSVQTLQTAVQTSDTSHLTKISGISKKVAEKIVMELKDKVDKFTHTEESKIALKEAQKNDNDVVEALKALGYSQNEARDILKEIPKTITKTSEKIREALKKLGK